MGHSKCFVWNCSSNYASDVKKAKQIIDEYSKHQDKERIPESFRAELAFRTKAGFISTYKASKNQQESWRRAIPQREGVIFEEKHCICAKHFAPNCFADNSIIIEGNRVELPTRRKLTKDAIPSIFPDTPKYLKKEVPKKRNGPPLRKMQTKRRKTLKQIKQMEPCDNVEFMAETLEVSATENLGNQSTDVDLTFSLILRNFQENNLALPKNWIHSIDDECTSISLSKLKYSSQNIPEFIGLTLILHKNGQQDLFALGRKISTKIYMTTCEDLLTVIKQLDTNFKCCIGYKKNCNLHHDECSVLLPFDERHARSVPCEKTRKRMYAESYYNTKNKDGKVAREKRKKSTGRLRMLQLSTTKRQLLKKVINLESKLNCANIKIEDLEKNSAYNRLSSEQKVVVDACLENAKRKPKGRRYNSEWLYECLLIRIRSPQLYRHIRKRNILPLPNMSTINKHLRNMPSTYGFLNSTFKILKMKGESMSGMQKRGVLMVDEMKLTPDTKFNISNHEFEGFVDLGKYTTEKERSVLGDHALVFMFQPFVGNWCQAIGCFLSKNNVNGDRLAKLCLEAIILMENAGYHVDGMVCDGASWNRKMWEEFAIDESKGSCVHPSAPNTRRFHFFSDFPHLIKNFRTFVLNAKVFQIPEGIVKLSHWQALIKDQSDPMALSITARKFSARHLKDDNLTKMNVKLAFQFFSNTVQSAMETLAVTKADVYPELRDCGPTIGLIQRVNRLIDIMNSKNPKFALWKDDRKGNIEFLEDFLMWLDHWDDIRNPSYKHLSESTRRGLRVTIRSTIALHSMLTREQHYSYLMTDRLNQDALEHFFGMLRYNGGLNQHPNASAFANLYRLMSVYSLVKPNRGSNVSGAQICETLFQLGDLKSQEKNEKKSNTKEDIFKKISDILESGSFDPNIQLDLTKEELDSVVESYMAGYIAKEAKRRWCRFCSDCQKTLVSTDPESQNLRSNLLIANRSYGNLTYPSVALHKLTYALETVILKTLQKELNYRTLQDVMDALLNSGVQLPKIGCKNHCEQVTQQIIYFFATTRMYFASRVEKTLNVSRQKAKDLVKKSKLITKAANKSSSVLTKGKNAKGKKNVKAQIPKKSKGSKKPFWQK